MRFFAIALALTFVACGGGQQSISKKSKFQAGMEGAPAWVQSLNCTQPPVDNPGKKVCGVGSHVIRSAQLMNLAQRTATAEASAAIALFLKQQVETLQKNYEGEYAQGTTNEASDADGKTGSLTVAWAKMALPGVRPVASWISGDDNYYVLAVMDSDKALEALKGFSGLSATQKNIINSHEKEFLDLLESKGKEGAQ